MYEFEWFSEQTQILVALANTQSISLHAVRKLVEEDWAADRSLS